jgi:hypothetical protein
VARIEPLASGEGFAALHTFRECIDKCGFPPGAALIVCDFAWELAPFFKRSLEQLFPPHVPVLVVNGIVPSGPGHEIEVEDDSGFCLLQLLPDVPGHVRAMPLRIDLQTDTHFWMFGTCSVRELVDGVRGSPTRHRERASGTEVWGEKRPKRGFFFFLRRFSTPTTALRLGKQLPPPFTHFNHVFFLTCRA